MGGFIQGRLAKWPTKFYLDSSLTPNVCRALDLLRDDIVHPWQESCQIAPSAEDRIWLPIVGDNDWVVVMRDRRIKSRPEERKQLLEHGVRAFLLKRAGNYTRWETVQLLTSKWDEMEAKAETEPGPYIYSVTKGPLRLWLS